uniref:Triple gene block 1 n=1 Tax=Hibiscus chlorotic speck associated virus 2 TaxID=3143943 RepID=A0AAU7L1V8_9VIRU
MKMNSLEEILTNNSFTRTKLPLSDPIVVHGVPGSGKTSAIEEIIKRDPFVTAISGGAALHNFDGSAIHRRDKDYIGNPRVIDEYPLFNDLIVDNSSLVFCDPFQHYNNTRKAHFVSFKTHRFGAETCSLLKVFNLDILSSKVDRVIFGCCYKEDPEGQILAFEEDICSLLDKHGIEYKSPENILGANCDKVTFYTSKEQLFRDDPDFWKFYICMTRHREKLKILSPNATFTAARSF